MDEEKVGDDLIDDYDEEVDDDFNDDHEGEDIAFSCIRQTHSIHLPVISSAFSQQGEMNDGKETTIFHAFTKIRDKNRKESMDHGSCINPIYAKLIEKDGLNALLHSHPFKIP